MYNLIFFGSDQYSAIVLSHLLAEKKIQLSAVVTDRGKPKDREQIIEPNPVEKLAKTHNLKVLYYPPEISELSTLIDKQTLGLCASFDHLVPKEIIGLFHGHLYNLHPSLLPQYRNVAPVQYAIALGDKETGITLFKITTGIDNGEIVGQISEPILASDTTPTLSARLFEQGAKLFLALLVNSLQPLPYTTYEARSPNLVFTRRLSRDSGHLEWEVFQKLITSQSVTKEETTNLLLQLRLSRKPTPDIRYTIPDLLRALTPWPGVWTMAKTKKGEIRLSIESVDPLMVKIAGKPKAVAWHEFAKYYL